MNEKALTMYLSIFGFILVVAGLFVAYSSVSMVQADDAAFAGSSLELLVGALVAVVGAMLLLIGFFSAKRRTRLMYY